jgi:hypothetical protein
MNTATSLNQTTKRKRRKKQMKKVINFIKENWVVLTIAIVIIGLAIVGSVISIRRTSNTSEPTLEFTQEEFELELIHIDLQKHYGYKYFQRLDYEVLTITQDNMSTKMYLLTYLTCTSEGKNEIVTYLARVEQEGDVWDVDTEVVYYK